MFGLQIMGRWKCYFISLPFLFFQMSNDYCQNSYAKTILFIMDFEGSNAFCFLIFSNERNITISRLMINLKCAVVHYAILNSSSLNKPYLWAIEYCLSNYFVFFEFLFRFVLTSLSLFKTLWKVCKF